MNRLFALLGKLILGTILLAAVLTGGYLVGTHKNLSEMSVPSIPETDIQKAQAKPSNIPTQTPQKPPTETKKIVKGGLGGETTSFYTYSLQMPNGWTDKRETTADVGDKLTLTKDDYILTIYQAAFGGGGCIYKGNPPAKMTQAFSDFVQIISASGEFRRSWNEDLDKPIISYTICQKSSVNSYGSPTQFGSIHAVSPNPADKELLSEMDSIIASLTKE